ncbi:fatty acyl-AMP ligase [Sneathiella sp.]|uniref:fatty acyl-AMP ligase n=1 Tax=Sneathiella sp. TaxID=1964365 RepID=UPI003566D498
MDEQLVEPIIGCETWGDLLSKRAELHGSRIAFSYRESGSDATKQISYRELFTNARQIASHLSHIVVTGDRILIFHNSGLGFIQALWGCIFAGAVAVPAFPPRSGRRSMERLNKIANDVGANFALLDSATLTRIKPTLESNPTLNHIQMIATDDLLSSTTVEPRNVPKLDGDSLAIVQYTSGSTSNPRGVMLKHRALLHNAHMIGCAFDAKEDSVNVGWLPLYHDMGLVGNVMAPLFHGLESVLIPPESFLLKPERWLQTISNYGARTSGGPNFAYELCINRIPDEAKVTLDLSSWEVAFCGAEPVRPDTLRRFTNAFSECGFRKNAFYPCYGLAEATLLVSGGEVDKKPIEKHFSSSSMKKNKVVPTTNREDARSLVGCGRAWNNQKIIIVDPDSGELSKSDLIGEICVQGSSVAAGYWNNAQSSSDTFGYIPKGSQEGQFLRTGDLGFVHEGELYIVGRSKALICISGDNFFSEDIEYTVEKSNPAVYPLGVSVFGVEENNKERVVVITELNRTFVKSQTDDDRSLDQRLKDLDCEIRVKVAEQHGLALKEIVFVRQMSIQKTTSGKVRRDSTRSSYLNNTLKTIV